MDAPPLQKENLPQEFKTLPFILWRYEERDGKQAKVPISPKNGQFCSVTDKDQYDTLGECVYLHEQQKFRSSGIGVVFTGDDYYGIDLDHCFEEGGDKEVADDFLKNFKTYAEYSPSKTGLHIYGFGRLPDGPRRKGNIEFYDSGRFFTVTGDAINGKQMLSEPDTLRRLYKKYLKGEEEEEEKKSFKSPHQSNTPEDLIHHINQSQQARNFNQLMSGDIAAYPSQSEADAALCMILAFWTKKDSSKIDEIFRTSQLYRPKWDQKHSQDGSTYGEMTIRNCIGACVEIYKESIPRIIKEEDLDEDLPEEFPRLPVEVPGVAGVLANFMDKTAIHPQPILHIGASLALLGALLGRKVKSESGLRTNMYVLSLAPTGAGKEHARSVIDRVLTHAGGIHYLGGDDIASDTGLLSAMEEQQSLLLMLDEFGHMANQFLNPRASGFKAAIVEVLLSIYAKSATAYHGKMYANRRDRPQIRIEQPSLSLYCTSTPESFWPAIRQHSVHDGFLNRFLIFSNPDPFPPFIEREDIHIPDFLIEPIKALVRMPEPFVNRVIDGSVMNPIPDPKVIKDSPEAKECFLDYRENYIKRAKKDPNMASLWKRAEAHSIKVSLILAASDLQEEVSGRIAEISCKIVEFSIDSMFRQVEDHMAENQHEANIKKVLRIIKKAGKKGIDGTSLVRKTQHLTSKQRIEVVEVMTEIGQIYVNPVKSANGKVKNTYFAV